MLGVTCNGEEGGVSNNLSHFMLPQLKVLATLSTRFIADIQYFYYYFLLIDNYNNTSVTDKNVNYIILFKATNYTQKLILEVLGSIIDVNSQNVVF